MSKSILVIETPKNCRECKFSEFQGIVCRAIGLNKAHNNADSKPGWCPLEEIKMSNDLISRESVIAIIENKRLLVGKHDLSAEYKLAEVQEQIEKLSIISMKNIIELLTEKAEYAENKATEYDEKGNITMMDIWDTEAKSYRNAIEIVKSYGAANE